MRTISQSRLYERFGNANCRYWLKNIKGVAGTATFDKVPWKYVERVTVLFSEPKCYLVDGDACYRDGVAFVVLPDKSKRKH